MKNMRKYVRRLISYKRLTSIQILSWSRCVYCQTKVVAKVSSTRRKFLGYYSYRAVAVNKRTKTKPRLSRFVPSNFFQRHFYPLEVNEIATHLSFSRPYQIVCKVYFFKFKKYAHTLLLNELVN